MTQPQQPPQQPPAQPTVADQQAVSAAVAQAAQDAPTPAQARTDAAAAAQRVGDQRGIKLTDDEAKMIANAVVSAMEQRGAFDAPLEPVSAPAATSPAGEPVAPPPAAAAGAPGVGVEQPPRKRSFAQRFLGE